MKKTYENVELTYTEDHVQAVISAVEFLRRNGRSQTAADLAELLVIMGGPHMAHEPTLRHQGPA